MKATRQEVYEAIDLERNHQDKKWGAVERSISDHVLILESELAEVKEAFVRTGENDLPLAEMIQVAAVAVRCLETHGVFSIER